MSTFIQTPNPGSGLTQSQRTGAPGQRKQIHFKRRCFIGMMLIALVAGLLTYLLGTLQTGNLNDLHTFSNQSQPALDSTQNLINDLETLDTWASDFLSSGKLTGQQSCTISGLDTTSLQLPQVCDAQNMDTETIQLNQDLFTAIHNATPTYTGQQTIFTRISIGIESYLTDIHQMRVDYALAGPKKSPLDPHVAQAYKDYQAASTILTQQITLPGLSPTAPGANLASNQIPFNAEENLPQCNDLFSDQYMNGGDQWLQAGLLPTLFCLSSINQPNRYTIAFESSNFLAEFSKLLMIFFGSILFIYTLNMLKWTHRLVTPGLLLATVLGIVLSIFMANTLQTLFTMYIQMDNNAINTSSTDQFQTYALDTRANMSRWLLAETFNDPTDANTWLQAAQYDLEMVPALQQSLATNSQGDTTTANAIGDWDSYVSIAHQLLYTTKDLQDAENLKIGEADGDFSIFSGMLVDLQSLQHTNFTQTTADAQNTLMLSLILDLTLFPLTALLAAWGFASRLKHF